jgi:hypothetical protein
MICPRIKGMRHERVRSMGSVAPTNGKRAVLKEGENLQGRPSPIISHLFCGCVARDKKRRTTDCLVKK